MIFLMLLTNESDRSGAGGRDGVGHLSLYVCHTSYQNSMPVYDIFLRRVCESKARIKITLMMIMMMAPELASSGCRFTTTNIGRAHFAAHPVCRLNLWIWSEELDANELPCHLHILYREFNEPESYALLRQIMATTINMDPLSNGLNSCHIFDHFAENKFRSILPNIKKKSTAGDCLNFVSTLV